MKPPLRGLAAVVILFLAAGCTTIDSRISRQQAAFDSWPAGVQANVRAGRIAVGFTPEMVQVALGDADRVSTRTTAQGTDEVWSYADHSPKFSFGVGVGVARGSSAYGGGVVVGDSGFRDGEVLRVIFQGGRVVAIEERRK